MVHVVDIAVEAEVLGVRSHLVPPNIHKANHKVIAVYLDVGEQWLSVGNATRRPTCQVLFKWCPVNPRTPDRLTAIGIVAGGLAVLSSTIASFDRHIGQQREAAVECVDVS